MNLDSPQVDKEMSLLLSLQLTYNQNFKAHIINDDGDAYGVFGPDFARFSTLCLNIKIYLKPFHLSINIFSCCFKRQIDFNSVTKYLVYFILLSTFQVP